MGASTSPTSRCASSAIWDLVEDGLLLVDEQRFIRRWNRAAKRLLGLSDADLDGTPFGSLRWSQSGEGKPDPAALFGA